MDKQEMNLDQLLTDATDSLIRAASRNAGEGQNSRTDRLLAEAIEKVRQIQLSRRTTEFNAFVLAIRGDG